MLEGGERNPIGHREEVGEGRGRAGDGAARMRWWGGLVVLLAALAAVGAFFAAWATKRAAEAQVLLELLNDYAMQEMAEALRTLRAWQAVNGDTFANEWELMMARNEPASAAVDDARHRVTSFFRSADGLWQVGMISRRTARAAVDKPGLAVLITICAPLERKLDPRVNLGFMRRLRALCPDRRDLIPPVPMSMPE
jgi:hypothetical protein